MYLYKTFLTPPSFLLDAVSDDMYGKCENPIIRRLSTNLIKLF